MAETLRVIVIDDNPNRVYDLINSIKALGYVVRGEQVSSKDALHKELLKAPADFILQNLDFPAVTLDQAYRVLRGFDQRPVLIALAAEGHYKPAEVMKSGANDLVYSNDLEHLQQVVKRNLKTHHEGKTLAHIKSNFADLEKLYATLMESYEAPVAYLHEGIHVHANRAYRELFGLTSSEKLEGIPLMDLLPEAEQQRVKSYLQQHKQGEGDLLERAFHIEIDGEEYQIEIADVFYESEPCQQVLFRHSQAHADNSQLTEQLSYLAIYDIASGLYTRNHLFAQLERAIGRATDTGEQAALVMLSLDNYNELASGLGLAEADLLYAEVGTELKSQLDLDDVLCRYDAQTFCLLSNLHERSEVQRLIRQLIDSINAQLFDINGKQVPCQLSAGLVMIDENAGSEYQLISSALETLRKANLKGIDFDTDETNRRHKPQKLIDQEWTEQLRLALKEGNFRLFFQPIVRLDNDHIKRYSVSIKIATPDGSFISPAQFLPSAERTGYAKGVDRWVIMNALRLLANAAREDRPTLYIKLTQGTLYYEEDISWIKKKIEETRIAGQQLVFEISTALLINHLQQTRLLVEDLSPLGCRFCVDDFGTSLNPFQILRHIRVDYLKLHGSLIDELKHSDDTRQLIMHLVERAHEEGLEVIAPRITTADQLYALNNLNIDLAQGDFLQRPSESFDFDFQFVA